VTGGHSKAVKMPQIEAFACRAAIQAVHVFAITEMMPSTDVSITRPPGGRHHKTNDRRIAAGDCAKEKP
tara:strand:- start:921 stop:1127 length:207 start_codon:yes stop_codon:yes gene_type:complete